MTTLNLKTHKYYSLLQLTTYGCFLLLVSSPFTSAENLTPPSPLPDSLSLEQPFNPTMAIVMVVLVCAFFVLGFFSIYLRQCIERRFRRVHGTATATAGEGDEGGPPRRVALVGLDASVIETFPTFLYSSVKGLKIGKGSLECAVCLNEFQEDETLRLIPKCCHVFHPECIDAWLASHVTCPVCRANLVPKPDDLPSGSVRFFEPGEHCLEPVEPQPSENPVWVFDDGSVDSRIRGNPPQVESLESNLLYPVHRSRSIRSWSARWQFRGMLFPRSHSTGHSLVQPGENMERFTLRLPEDVRNEIINTARLNGTKSNVVFARARSSRRGYRSASVGSTRRNNYFNYERFGQDYRSNHPGFSFTPPTSNLQSVESIGLNRVNVKKDDQNDEGSSDWLRHTNQV